MPEAQAIKTRADELAAFERVKANPDAMTTIFRHLANGGHLFDLLEIWGAAYSDVLAWIHDDDRRRDLYTAAIQTQTEYVKREVLDTLRKIARFDIRQLYDERGALLHPVDWPHAAAFAVAGVDVFEEYQGRGDERELVGYTKKVKLRDNLKAFEMIGKNLALFIERHEHTHRHTLEALVMAAIQPPAERPTISQEGKSMLTPSGTDPGVFDSVSPKAAPTFPPQDSENRETQVAEKQASPEMNSEKNFPKNSDETGEQKSKEDLPI